MRKAAAHSTFDCELADYDDAPARRPRAAGWFRAGRATRFGIAGLTLLTGAIVFNALVLQDQRHAAPLFQMNLRTPAVAALETPPPLPTPRPADLAPAPVAKPAPAPRMDPIAREISRTDQTATRLERPKSAEGKSVEAKAPVEARSADAKHNDLIGGLIRNVGFVQPQQSNEPDRAVAAAQRALMKLGFVVKPDGVFGVSTRQAIERFERDNRMPVRGDLSPKIKRELARASGVQVD